jgi:hypothetical protein
MGDNADLILVEYAKAMKKLTSLANDVQYITHCDTEIAFINYLKGLMLTSSSILPHHGSRKLIDIYNGMDVVVV